MTEETFILERGDVVTLNCGSPRMVVAVPQTDHSTKSVKCMWIDMAHNVRTHEFSVDILYLVKKQPHLRYRRTSEPARSPYSRDLRLRGEKRNDQKI